MRQRSKMADDNTKNLLIVIFDVNPFIWGRVSAEGNENQVSLSACLDSLMVMCNAYLLMKHTNTLAFVASSTGKSKFIFPRASSENEDGSSLPGDSKYEKFAEMNDAILEEIKEIISNIDHEGHDSKHNSDSDLPGALCKTLCYIHRIGKDHSVGVKLRSRILVVKSSPDVAAQYMPVMNSIFAAQKSNTVIDACVLHEHSGYLQQAADITGGVYLKIPETQALLQYLLWLYLPDSTSRNMLVLPSSQHIDYRAACFCHRKLVDVGFVCSVCLSIYCNLIPRCQTCQTRFKLPARPMPRQKKKNKTTS